MGCKSRSCQKYGTFLPKNMFANWIEVVSNAAAAAAAVNLETA